MSASPTSIRRPRNVSAAAKTAHPTLAAPTTPIGIKTPGAEELEVAGSTVPEEVVGRGMLAVAVLVVVLVLQLVVAAVVLGGVVVVVDVVMGGVVVVLWLIHI